MENIYNASYLLLVLAATIWGAQPVVVKPLLKEMSPIMITLTRYVGVSAILLIILFIKEKRILPPVRWIVTLSLMGAAGIALNNTLQFAGLQYSTAINCTLVSATTPVITAILASAFLKEQLQAVQWGGIVISVTGVIFLVTHGSVEAISSFSFNYGDILFFCSQVCWAVYSLLGRKIMMEFSPLAVTAWAGAAGTVLMAIVALWEGSTAVVEITGTGILSMSYLIFGGGVLAMTCWNCGVKEVGPSRAAIFTNIMPVVGMLLAVLFLGEQLSRREIVGGLWIVTGVYLTNHPQVLWRRKLADSYS